jgi:solute carrier family 25 (mitochondrial carnitine/acylcarnitine transporter), member 20/29
LQTQDPKNPKFNGALDCIKQTLRNEGPRGFFKGMSSPIAGVGGLNAVLFGAYGFATRSLSDSNAAAGKARQLTIGQVALAGSLAGIVNTIICSPVEMLKTQLQIQYNNPNEPPKYKGPMDLAKHIMRTDGASGLARGIVSCTYRESIANGAFYATFEFAKRFFARQQGVDPSRLQAHWLVLSGSLAGIGYWTSSYPLDVIKSRIQSDPFGGAPRKYVGVVQTARLIIAEEGAAALFKGFATCIARTIPAAGATFLAYEMTMRALNT